MRPKTAATFVRNQQKGHGQASLCVLPVSETTAPDSSSYRSFDSFFVFSSVNPSVIISILFLRGNFLLINIRTQGTDIIFWSY